MTHFINCKEQKYFYKLDFWFGYHQLKIETENIFKTAFRTKYDHHEFIVIPYGLTNDLMVI